MNLRTARLQPARTVPNDLPLITVAKVLRDERLRHVYVLDKKEFPVGVLSAVDIVNKVVAEGKDPKSLRAKDVMTTPLHMVEIDNEVGKAYAEILHHGTGSVPVMDNGILVGVLSMGEAMRLVIGEKRGGKAPAPKKATRKPAKKAPVTKKRAPAARRKKR